MPETSDEEVVQASLADKERFAELVTRYEAKLSRYLERLGVGGSEDREDILQNVFIKAYRNLRSFDPSLKFSSWIYRIAHNEAMSSFRAKRIRPVPLGEGEGETLASELKDESADVAAFAEARLSAKRLSVALAELPFSFREILTLRFLEDRSYNEISDILEVPLGTVSTLLYRAKRELKKILSSKGTYE